MNIWKQHIQYDELIDNPKFECVCSFEYRNIAGFIQENISPRGRLLWLFYSILFTTVVMFGYYSFLTFHHKLFSPGSFLISLTLYSLIAVIPMVIIHELLHALVFLVLGAPKITFGAQFKQLVFYVTSNRFVLNRFQFSILALTPFIVISALLIAALQLGNLQLKWISSLLLMWHTSCCIGDFILISFFKKISNGHETYTFDDIETQTTNFYKKLKD